MKPGGSSTALFPPAARAVVAWAAGLLAVLAAAQEEAPGPAIVDRGAGKYSAEPAVREHGRALFTQYCASCHALAQDGIGPPLGGVTTLFTPEELAARILDPVKVFTEGDARAVALVRRYKVAMPPLPQLPAADLASILAFIRAQSAAQHLSPLVVDLAAPATPPPRLVPPVRSSDLAIEVEDFVEIPRLPGRAPYNGITLVRPDPREAGALFVDELMGLLYRVKDRKVEVFLDVRKFFPEFLCNPGVASGLGSFALHPDFRHNGIFYTTHSENFRGSPAVNLGDIPADVPKGATPPLEWVLTEWQLADPAAPVFAGTHREVLRFITPTTAHGSQEIAFAPVSDPRDPDYAKLYWGIGDGGAANLKRPDLAGHPHTFLASIVRIDPAGHDGPNGHYGVPADNPFAQAADPAVRREIWAYGFRNPHRFTWDFSHGRRTMIAVDIGEANIEEVNLIEKGGAYGWGVGSLEGTTHLDIKVDAKIVRAATAAELAGTIAPFGEYDHLDGSAVTGGFVYHGPLEVLRDKYIFGDIVSGRLFFMNFGARLTDHTIYELPIVRDGAVIGLKALAHVSRAHLRLGYDERTGDLFLLTKEDGMIRRVKAAFRK